MRHCCNARDHDEPIGNVTVVFSSIILAFVNIRFVNHPSPLAVVSHTHTCFPKTRSHSEADGRIALAYIQPHRSGIRRWSASIKSTKSSESGDSSRVCTVSSAAVRCLLR